MTIFQADITLTESIWEFIKTAYGDHAWSKFPDRWNWQFVHNPFWSGEKLPIWIALADDRIVGQNCAMYVPLKVENKTYMAAWSVDTIVLPEFRRKGIATQLQETSSQFHQVFMSLSMSNLNRKVKYKIGSVSLPPVKRYRKFNRIRSLHVYRHLLSLVEKHPMLGALMKIFCRIFQLHRIISAVLNCLFAVSRLSEGRDYIEDGVDIIELDKFGAANDNFWKSIRTDFDFAVERTSEYLNWKFFRQPDKIYHCYIAEKENVMFGYIIMRIKEEEGQARGIIADLVTARSDDLTRKILLRFAECYFSRKADYIDCATSVPEYQNSLRKRKYLERGSLIPVIKCLESSIHDPAASGTWLLSLGDQDLDR